MILYISIIALTSFACNTTEQLILCGAGSHLVDTECVLDETPSIETVIICWDKGNYCESRTDHPGCESPAPWVYGIQRKPSCAGEVSHSEGSMNICQQLPVELTCCSALKDKFENDQEIECTGDEFIPKINCDHFGACQTNNPCVYSYCDERVNLCEHSVVYDGGACENIPYMGIGKDFHDEECICFKGQPYIDTPTEIVCWYLDQNSNRDHCREETDDEPIKDCDSPTPLNWLYDENTFPECECEDGSTFVPDHQECCYKLGGNVDGECISSNLYKDNSNYQFQHSDIICEDKAFYCETITDGECQSPEPWFYNEMMRPSCICPDRLSVSPIPICHNTEDNSRVDPYPNCWDDTQCFASHNPCTINYCSNSLCKNEVMPDTNFCRGDFIGTPIEDCRCDENGDPVYE